MSIAITYRRLRNAGMGGVVGENALQCWQDAHIIEQFRKLESDGLVRLQIIPDDFPDLSSDDPHCEKAMWDMAERNGVWGVVGKYKCSHCGGWMHGDSVWGFVEKDPGNPYSNPYVVDIMAETIRQIGS